VNVQTILIERDGGTPVRKRAHVGAVASGNLEVLCEPPKAAGARIVVTTSVDGFGPIWRATLDRFLDRHPVSAEFEINDFGATPAMVSLRLEQALELAR
jgi:malonate decarboxylase delta subunit